MNMTAIYDDATSTMAHIIGLESERLSKAISSNMSSDGDLDVSPVTLSSAWSRVARLLLLASLAVGGSVGNVFMISAVVVEDQLNKRGTPAKSIFTIANKNDSANQQNSLARRRNRSRYINLRWRIKIVKATLGRIERGRGRWRVERQWCT